MATPFTQVDIENMHKVQPYFQNAVEEVNTTCKNMQNQIDTLTVNWTGGTASAFLVAVDQWLRDLNVVDANLQTILQKLASHTGVYANTQEQSDEVAQAFKQGMTSFPIGLGI